VLVAVLNAVETLLFAPHPSSEGLRLSPHGAQVRQLMSLGYQYAERMEAAGVLDAHFGQYRRMHWPGWRPTQVRGVTYMARVCPLSDCTCSHIVPRKPPHDCASRSSRDTLARR